VGTYNLSGNVASGTGLSMISATIVTVSDNTISAPPPTYAISYTSAINTALNIQVTLANASNPPANALSLLQSSAGLAMAFSGADGLPPLNAQIGGVIYASRLYPTIASILPGIAILNVQVGTGGSLGSSLALNINQTPVMGSITLNFA
jgi:uncharacterized phage protein gp47/JayE